MTLIWEDLRDPPSRAARWRATLRKQPSAFLLAVQILVILLLPVLEYSDWGRAVISLLSLSAARHRGVHRAQHAGADLALGDPRPARRGVRGVEPRSTTAPPSSSLAHCALAVFYFYTAYALIAYMFEDYWVTKDELFAVGRLLHGARLRLRLRLPRHPGDLARLVHVLPGRGPAHLPRAALPLGAPSSPASACPTSCRSCRRLGPSARSSSSPASCTSRWSSPASSRSR